jgi:hypothetical protein
MLYVKCFVELIILLLQINLASTRFELQIYLFLFFSFHDLLSL